MDKDPVSPTEVTMEFEQEDYTLRENGERIVSIRFSRVLSNNANIEIAINEISGVSGEDYSFGTAIADNRITTMVAAGVNRAEVSLTGIQDSDMSIEEIELELIASDDTGINLGNQTTSTITIVEESYIDPEYQSCLPTINDDEFEIATWNIKFFPQNGNTLHSLLEFIPNTKIDLIGVQEIQNTTAFMNMADQLSGWTGVVENVNGDIELGFLYRESAISSFGSISKLFSGDTNAYPREAIIVDVTHVNGLSAKVINLHMKCCDDGRERRADASNKLKEYIDVNLADDNVIVVGDFNESLSSTSSFSNFTSDADNYFFADQEISDGDIGNWSFPSFPSHIDHILCTSELADNVIGSYTLALDNCISSYSIDISDHRPVVAVFK